jgi:multisubunit Na+/H+ antiporter MnhF subunit
MKWTRKPGEPIYLRRHLLSLALAVVFPLVLLQLYRIYVGPLSFDFQLGVGLFLSVILGVVLHLAYRSSAKNQP